MRTWMTMLTAAAGLGWMAAASACEIEDMRWVQEGAWTTIEGVATCERGSMYLRLYRGGGEKPEFLAVKYTSIRGYIFEANAENLPALGPDELVIRYVIEED